MKTVEGSSPLRVQLIIPPPDSELQGVGFYGCFPPLGLITLASYLKTSMPEIDIEVLDGSVCGQDSLVENAGADIVGVSTLGFNYQNSLEVCRAAKRAGAVTVLGNQHARYLYRCCEENPGYLHHRPEVDVIVPHMRGEIVFAMIVSCLARKGDMRGIAGVAIREGEKMALGGQVAESPCAPVGPLDRSLIRDETAYWDEYNRVFGHGGRERIRPGSMNSTVGCGSGKRQPCLYCCLGDHRGDNKAIQNFGQSALAMGEHGYDLVFEVCNSLTSFPQTIEAARPILAGNGPELMIYGTAHEIDAKMAQALAAIRCRRVILGFDSGSEVGLRSLRKSYTDPKTNLEAAAHLSRVGIGIYACYVAGVPGETPETLLASERQIHDLLENYKVDMIEFTSLLPLPGSAAFKRIERTYLQQGKPKERDCLDIDRLAAVWLSEETKLSLLDYKRAQERVLFTCQKSGVRTGGYY